GMTAMLAPAVAQGAAADAAWPVFGNPQGRVTITEFFEYQCPNCKRLHPQLEAFVKEHGSIRLVMKDWPIFGDISVYASRMALAAGYTGSYQRALHGLMDLKGRLTMKRVDDSLKAAGMDTDRVRDALELNFNSIQAVLDSHAAEAKSLGLAGTPAFIVGTRLYPRVTDIDAIRAAVDKG
ncbi:MAG: DsbA family protein, partial [Alphaproteobacteria bacterium]